MAVILPFTSIIYEKQHVFHTITRYSVNLLSLWSLNSLHSKEQNGIIQKRAERSRSEFSLLIPRICSEHILVLCYSTSSDLSRTCSPDLLGGALSRTEAIKSSKTTLHSQRRPAREETISRKSLFAKEDQRKTWPASGITVTISYKIHLQFFPLVKLFDKPLRKYRLL